MATALAAATAAQVGLQLTGSVLGGGSNVRISSHSVDLIHGEIAFAPLDIDPAQQMQFGVRKTNWGFYGSKGAAVFEIADRVLFIFWQIPLTSAGGTNELAIAFGRPGQKKSDFYGSSKEIPGFSEFKASCTVSNKKWNAWDFHQYGDSVRYVDIQDDRFMVRGTMDTTRYPDIKIEVIPRDTNQFASPLKRYI